VGDGAWGEVKVKSTVINTRHITGATGLVLLGFKTERVDIYTSRWDIGVVLVWLNKVKVAAIALREAIVTIKLDLTSEDRVHTTVKERGTRGINKSVPTGNAHWLVIASPGEIASSWASATEDILDHSWVEAVITGTVNLRDTLANGVPSTTVGVASLNVAWSSEGATVLFLGVFVFFVETSVLKTFLAWVAITFVNAASFIKVNVFLMASLGTTVVLLVVRDTGTSTVLGVWEPTTTTVGLAVGTTTTAWVDACFGWAKGVVVVASVFTTFAWFATDITKPFISSLIPVAVKINSLVSQAKVKVLRINHASAEWIIRSTREVGNINGISEVEVLWATVWVGGKKINIRVRLYNPDKLLDWVVKVKLNLVAS
jgi:hypothetical protein